MPNQLIHETSPYLLQHAHNPVHWYPWGDEALQKAVTSDKPILVSIGYAACHWCHVMERESFEDPAIADFMNEYFINIKIDREERPDLDHIYMDALQTMTGSGGWPLNVFLTPNKKPFYGGTYYPPQPFANRPSWRDVLAAVADAFGNKRADIEKQASGLTQHIADANNFGIHATGSSIFAAADMHTACFNLLQQADTVWGGFGSAPKFPQTFSIRYLLRYYYLQKNNPESQYQSALQQALLSLDKMINGGIYDQLGGGFSRYSTDTEWLAPHFEKMLYDNALLVITLAEAYQITHNEKYRTCIEQTIAFIERELTDIHGGFYSALDADSEGEEGKYYVWDFDEVNELLGDDAAVFCNYYNITKDGNWFEETTKAQGKNILRVLESVEKVAAANNCTVDALNKILAKGKSILLAAREKRIRPLLDDKIILGWNALMSTALCFAYAATGNGSYKEKAIKNIKFLLQHFEDAAAVRQGKIGAFHHVWKNGLSKFPAFLDDLAYLVQALLKLHRITGDTQWLLKANQICETIQKDFIETATGYFYYTPQHQQDVILRKKEVYDGATPSGNAVMAANLLELSILLNKKEWRAQAEKMVGHLSNTIIKYPTSFGAWLLTLYQITAGTKEIVITGVGYKKALKEMVQTYLPNSVMMAAANGNDDFPLLVRKNYKAPVTLYICEDYACKKPVHTIKELLQQLNIQL